MTRAYLATLLLFVIGIALTLAATCGPARGSTTEDALEALCGPSAVYLAPHVDSAARRYLHHSVTLVAVMAKESRCQMASVGKAGEVCAMQLLGVAKNGKTKRQLRDPETCIHTGARWLALRQVDCGGGLLLGLSGYNARTCQGGKGYARRVLALVVRAWREMAMRREARS